MPYNTHLQYRVLTQATQNASGEFTGYFTIYLLGADLAIDQPYYRENRRKVTSSVSLIDALNRARQRGKKWIDTELIGASAEDN